MRTLQHVSISCAVVKRLAGKPRIFSPARMALLFGLHAALFGLGTSHAQDIGTTLHRGDNAVVIEPYAPNIVRVTLTVDKEQASAVPGYGIIGQPSMSGWSHHHESKGEDTFRSGQLVVRLSPDHLTAEQKPRPMPLDEMNSSLRTHYFGGNENHVYSPHDDSLTVSTPEGKELLTMQRWSMVPNKNNHGGEGTSTEGYRVSATFDSPSDEHYYGLGQHQQGFLDLRGHRINCWHDYSAPGGETLCVPFMVSSRGYGIVWDNPSKTTIDLGINGKNTWSSNIGDRVSFFLISGKTTDEIYAGYRQLTGTTHLLPRATYGYIQSKAIYGTQQQIMDVAEGYRKRNLPADVLVVDFLNMTRQGEMDLDPKRWPDAAGMNDKLHAMGFSTLLSVWPHYAPGTQFYDMLRDKGWLVNKVDGTPDPGGFTDQIGPNIDTTNPAAAKWFWERIRDRYINPDHFDYLWLDETEPDINPDNDRFSIGSGQRFFNVYPLFHTASVYDGFRRDFGDSRRVMILSRAAYLGAQRNGTIFWSSDIVSSWDMLKRSVPAGLGFTATGMPYWDTDIAGFFSPSLAADYKPAHTPLIDPSDVRSNVDRYSDYPELFVRWFEWGAFQPIMRAHGERQHNEVWAYGKQAEPILSKYLRLRYELLPYTYSLAYSSYQTGAPFMRALFMDFPNDAKVSGITDEYMYGPAFLVAPVTDQGATSREVYLPAGSDWYNYWTNERLKGGQTITVSAPIDTLPLFVRAGSIIPMGATVKSATEHQDIKGVRVYPGASSDFNLFTDDGTTYGYEKGAGSLTRLHWNNASGKLTHDGPAAWTQPDASILQVVTAGQPSTR